MVEALRANPGQHLVPWVSAFVEVTQPALPQIQSQACSMARPLPGVSTESHGALAAAALCHAMHGCGMMCIAAHTRADKERA